MQAGTATSVVVTSNANPAAVGGRPTWTATMSPTTVTSGSVGFYDGNLLLGSGTAAPAPRPTGRRRRRPPTPAPTHLRTYQVTAQTAGDANNNPGTSAPAALTIDKATASISVTGYCATFDAAGHTAAGSATGVLSESLTGLDLSGTTHTAVGTYAADGWTFARANYSNDSGTVGDGITDATIAVPANLPPSSSGTASVADAGAGATYVWSITGGAITGGAGTRSITFATGPGGTVNLDVTVTTTTGCSATRSASVNLDPIATIPALDGAGLALLAALLALAGAAALRAGSG